MPIRFMNYLPGRLLPLYSRRVASLAGFQPEGNSGGKPTRKEVGFAQAVIRNVRRDRFLLDQGGSEARQAGCTLDSIAALAGQPEESLAFGVIAADRLAVR